MNESQTFDIAVVGASGAVGEVLINLLDERDFPLGNLYPLGSDRSVGNKVLCGGKYFNTTDAATFDFSQVQIVLFAAPVEIAAQYAPIAVEAGCWVIDASGCFRRDEHVPLVVAEINPGALGQFAEGRIIASPGGVAIPMLLALKPIIDAVGISRINAATYQAVSSSGQAAVKELAGQTVSLLSMKDVICEHHDKQIAFNVLAQMGALQDNGYSLEEMELVWESQKVLDDDAIFINPTAVRVPVFFGHSLALHIETREQISAQQARDLLAVAPGVALLDEGSYPTAVTDAAGADEVFVGRVREDMTHPLGLDLWVVADNVRRGAALNCVQIAEILVKDYL